MLKVINLKHFKHFSHKKIHCLFTPHISIPPLSLLILHAGVLLQPFKDYRILLQIIFLFIQKILLCNHRQPAENAHFNVS